MKCCREKGRTEDVIRAVEKQCNKGLKKHYTKDMIKDICCEEGLDKRCEHIMEKILNSKKQSDDE